MCHIGQVTGGSDNGTSSSSCAIGAAMAQVPQDEGLFTEAPVLACPFALLLCQSRGLGRQFFWLRSFVDPASVNSLVTPSKVSGYSECTAGQVFQATLGWSKSIRPEIQLCPLELVASSSSVGLSQLGCGPIVHSHCAVKEQQHQSHSGKGHLMCSGGERHCHMCSSRPSSQSVWDQTHGIECGGFPFCMAQCGSQVLWGVDVMLLRLVSFMVVGPLRC